MTNHNLSEYIYLYNDSQIGREPMSMEDATVRADAAGKRTLSPGPRMV